MKRGFGEKMSETSYSKDSIILKFCKCEHSKVFHLKDTGCSIEDCKCKKFILDYEISHETDSN